MPQTYNKNNKNPLPVYDRQKIFEAFEKIVFGYHTALLPVPNLDKIPHPSQLEDGLYLITKEGSLQAALQIQQRKRVGDLHSIFFPDFDINKSIQYHYYQYCAINNQQHMNNPAQKVKYYAYLLLQNLADGKRVFKNDDLHYMKEMLDIIEQFNSETGKDLNSKLHYLNSAMTVLLPNRYFMNELKHGFIKSVLSILCLLFLTAMLTTAFTALAFIFTPTVVPIAIISLPFSIGIALLILKIYSEDLIEQIFFTQTRTLPNPPLHYIFQESIQTFFSERAKVKPEEMECTSVNLPDLLKMTH